MEQPRFTHDHDGCQYLGRHGEYDLYYCDRSDEGTVIARYGKEGSQYRSLPINMVFGVVNAALAEAARRKIRDWQEIERRYDSRRGY